jgi:hypothetical protein
MSLSLQRSTEYCDDEQRVAERKRYVPYRMLQGVKMKLEQDGRFPCSALLQLL